ncbi:transcriptional regulator [Streptomyces sp. LUP47B]|uniref:MmyB family transcriptional regulator n=1 Tax=Streptomyces sp. LUP47B TaxID=1890286 RepID=UPI00352305C7
MSTDRYTRLEHGRVLPSTSVLATLVRVLHLDDRRVRAAPSADVEGSAAAQTSLGELTATPALVVGRYAEILAWNAPAAALLTDFDRVPEKKRNYVRLLFTDPGFRKIYRDWRAIAGSCGAQLRVDAAKCPGGDPELAALVGELSVADADFRRWSAGRQVTGRRMGTKRLRHPVEGDLTLDWDSLICTADPAQQWVIWTAEPGSPSHDGLCFLASWAADPYEPVPGATA